MTRMTLPSCHTDSVQFKSAVLCSQSVLPCCPCNAHQTSTEALVAVSTGPEATDTQLPQGPRDTGQAVIAPSVFESAAVQFGRWLVHTPMRSHFRRVELRDRPIKAHPPIPNSRGRGRGGHDVRGLQ